MPENRTRPAYRIIGKAAPRPDAWAKVFGDTAYAHDYTVPGMLCAPYAKC